MTSHRPVPADSPVFVDRSGIRRRWFVVLGVAGAGVLALSVAALVAGFLGTGPGRLPGRPVPPPQVARQAAAGPVAATGSTPTSGSPRPTPSGAAATPNAAARPSATPVSPAAPTPTPSPTRHGNGNGPPPHAHKK